MGDKGQITGNTNSNYVFYVSELEATPLKGHFRKMDAGIEIVEHIKRSVQGSKVMRYTEYSGEMINADSVGIVFPAHNWGISLAVLTFLSHLRIKRGTYVYAVAVGETLSGDVDYTVYDRVKLLEQFERIFSKKSLGCKSDIFVRCIDRKRMHGSTEENLRGETDKVKSIKHVLSGLLFHTLDNISSMERLDGDDRYYEETKQAAVDVVNRMAVTVDMDAKQSKTGTTYYEEKSNIVPIDAYTQSKSKRISLSNVYLDEDIFRGVKLCQVM